MNKNDFDLYNSFKSAYISEQRKYMAESLEANDGVKEADTQKMPTEEQDLKEDEVVVPDEIPTAAFDVKGFVQQMKDEGKSEEEAIAELYKACKETYGDEIPEEIDTEVAVEEVPDLGDMGDGVTECESVKQPAKVSIPSANKQKASTPTAVKSPVPSKGPKIVNVGGPEAAASPDQIIKDGTDKNPKKLTESAWIRRTLWKDQRNRQLAESKKVAK